MADPQDEIDLLIGQEEPQEPKLFFTRVPGAFAYPLTGRGKYLIIAGALFFWLLSLVRSLSQFYGYLGIVIQLVLLVIGLILPAYLLEVLARSAGGQDEPPDWPQISNWLDDIVQPVCLILVAAFGSFFPAVLCRIAIWQGWMHNASIMWMLLAMGVLYFPMALMAVTLFDGIAGLNPFLVVPSIVKIIPAYLVACVLLAAVLATYILVRRAFLLPIPFLAPMVRNAISIYLLMVEMRILGLLYSTYEERLGWFTKN